MKGAMQPAPRGSEREILTPEGVSVRFELGAISSRVAAFGIDLFLIGVLFATVNTALAVINSIVFDDAWGWIASTVMLTLFALRTFYFMGFELLWRGQTPGKRAMDLRVVDAKGGALTPSALMARNLTREMELFLPLIALFATNDLLADSAQIVIRLLAASWTLLFLVMPWLNRDRMRLGDLAAGTIVVAQPKVALIEEVTAQSRGQSAAAFAFTSEQLDMYGIYEMQVLEDFLRSYPSNQALGAVAEKVARKIAWSGAPWRDQVRRFLEDYYDALRARREQQLLFGQRQESKRAGTLDEHRLEA